MVPIASLWLPILLAAVLVFVASSIIHMVLKYHRNDFRALPDEAFHTTLRFLDDLQGRPTPPAVEPPPGPTVAPPVAKQVPHVWDRPTGPVPDPWAWLVPSSWGIDVGTAGLALATKATMLRQARRVVVLADHTKVGNDHLVRFGDVADVDTLVTDEGLDDELCGDDQRQGRDPLGEVGTRDRHVAGPRADHQRRLDPVA